MGMVAVAMKTIRCLLWMELEQDLNPLVLNLGGRVVLLPLPRLRSCVVVKGMGMGITFRRLQDFLRTSYCQLHFDDVIGFLVQRVRIVLLLVLLVMVVLDQPLREEGRSNEGLLFLMVVLVL